MNPSAEALTLVEIYLASYTELERTTNQPHPLLSSYIRDLTELREVLAPKISTYEEKLQQHQRDLEEAARVCAYCRIPFTPTDHAHVFATTSPLYYHEGTCWLNTLAEINDERGQNDRNIPDHPDPNRRGEGVRAAGTD